MQSIKTLSEVLYSSGYTLIELMIVLAVVAIMLGMGAPVMRGVMNHNAETSAINVLVSGVASARSYALTHKRQVLIEAKQEDWSKGFFIRPDSIGNEPISETSFEDTKITIHSDAPFSFLVFDRIGRVTPANSTFTVCNENIGEGVEIEVNIFGKTNLVRDGNGKPVRVTCQGKT
jgi:prepilin-type N-terminal cleavage/methylation domain-containing protein